MKPIAILDEPVIEKKSTAVKTSKGSILDSIDVELVKKITSKSEKPANALQTEE